jgi:hypothetical protein
MARRKRGRGPTRRLVTWANDRLRVATQACGRASSRLMRRLRSEAPVVIVDGPAAQARHLRSLVTTTSRVFSASLGAALPANLVIVVQRVVHDGRHLNGSLLVFDSPEGGRRYLLQLAQSVNGRQVSDEEVLAAVRTGLVEVLEDLIGKPVRSTSIDLQVPRVGAVTPVVALRSNGQAPGPEPERGAIPIQRIENNPA